MPAAIMECGDYMKFQDALKDWRKRDDIIINAINCAVPTASFHVDPEKSCIELKSQIKEEHVNRKEAIQKCIDVAYKTIKHLKEQRESLPSADTDSVLNKKLRNEQSKLRLLKVEFSVEELVQQRSEKALQDKCRKYLKS